MSDALLAETVMITGHNGDEIEAYSARALDEAPRGGVVVIHHMPGYDDQTKEIARNFAYHGYNAVVPNLYWREAPGASPDDAAAASRAQGGVPDDRLVGDVAGAAAYLRAMPASNGKAGTIGYCSGGRQSFLAACSLPLDAAVDCYGACVVNPSPPGIPIHLEPCVHLADRLSCPLLGLFGEEEQDAGTGGDGATRRRPRGAPQDVRVPHLSGSRARVLRHRPAQLPSGGRERRVEPGVRLVRPVLVVVIGRDRGVRRKATGGERRVHVC